MEFRWLRRLRRWLVSRAVFPLQQILCSFLPVLSFVSDLLVISALQLFVSERLFQLATEL